MRITKKQAIQLGKKFNIDFAAVNFDEWHFGLNVELEHGKKFGLTNVTNDNLMTTAKIDIAHLLEFPDYYKRLGRLEDAADKYWKNKKKKPLFKS